MYLYQPFCFEFKQRFTGYLIYACNSNVIKAAYHLLCPLPQIIFICLTPRHGFLWYLVGAITGRNSGVSNRRVMQIEAFGACAQNWPVSSPRRAAVRPRVLSHDEIRRKPGKD
jgi:hypothetical protein